MSSPTAGRSSDTGKGRSSPARWRGIHSLIFFLPTLEMYAGVCSSGSGVFPSNCHEKNVENKNSEIDDDVRGNRRRHLLFTIRMRKKRWRE